jgi:ComF family protein
MKNLLFKIIDFVFPITCPSCGKLMSSLSKNRICAKCIDEFPKIEGLICSKCGYPLEEGGEFCYICRKKQPKYAFNKLRSVFIYKDKIRDLILKFKYGNRTYLSEYFANTMANFINSNDFLRDADIIIPVPLNIFRRLKRGYNQAHLLAIKISKQTGIPYFKTILFRQKITKPQFKLSKKERFLNMQGSFYVKNKNLIKKKNVLLIDDICTTCATASNCAKVLKEAGAKRIYVLTLSRDRLN